MRPLLPALLPPYVRPLLPALRTAARNSESALCVLPSSSSSTHCTLPSSSHIALCTESLPSSSPEAAVVVVVVDTALCTLPSSAHRCRP
eukprot:NODE_972_length_1288_cov_30.572587.p4 GENE.NODE_972_length_1288_cov_30.572587~~NODE_972_length_1288_cov_30.572587.p4  ORF type:complete len:89 (+),score=9.99 NODE_972_length_1288_cov_30.572587:244-510(+)